EVKHVINITDVGHLVSDGDEGEDKMEVGSQRENRSAWEIAEYYTEIFKQDIARLNIKTPGVWSKATDHIAEQIDLIKRLEEKGFTYLTSDGVYFDTSKFANYGYLARLDVEGLAPGARVEMTDEKRNPTDFALWKFSPKDHKRQMEWQSPWGTGFPGWHIECSAMAMKYLGETIDIHTGGIDHIPVHHTNEIAQSESATGKQFARYWMHVAFLTVDGKKMSKSLGNFATIEDMVKRGYDPLGFRYMALTSHYRAGLNFTWEGLAGVQKALGGLREKISQWDINNAKPSANLLEEFKKLINNDINTPQALALMWDVANDKSLPEEIKKATILEFDKVLGLNLGVTVATEIPDEVIRLAKQRDELRKEKKWEASDKIREEILNKGYELEDTSQGPKITKRAL
ncbi:MAG TPA: cysteine--tRNA ligase, partial [Candidatus Staskawiczbacteria bacterium]|nr:cysteine--tRNA ligase [Candidatus Staskawiczbacteria bacterium]